MNLLQFITPSKDKVAELIKQMANDQEIARMDFLSDPKQKFEYSIKADGRCHVSYPLMFVAPTLRAAIDHILRKNREKIIKTP